MQALVSPQDPPPSSASVTYRRLLPLAPPKRSQLPAQRIHFPRVLAHEARAARKGRPMILSKASLSSNVNLRNTSLR